MQHQSRLLFILLFCCMGNAYARTYSLPADIGSGAFSSCSGSGPVYSCSGSISIDEEDSVSITSDVTLNIDGNLSFDEEVSVNDNGNTLNFNVTGNVYIDEESTIDGNITADGTISIDSDSIVNGHCSPAHSRCTGGPLPPEGCDSYRDSFQSVSYSNQDGTANWGSNWVETNDNNAAGSGDIQITNRRLQIKDDNRIISRGADLSAFSSATLTFDYQESSFDNNNDYVDIEISGGGNGWTSLQQYAGSSVGSGSANITINASFLANDTQIRFVTSNSLGNSDYFRVDDLEIVACAASIDHYEIAHSSSGVTCEAESVSVTGHDASHAVVSPSSSTTITLSTSIANDGWALKSGGGAFSAPDQYTFDGTETVVEFWLTKTSATSAPHMDIDVTDGSATDADGDPSEDINLVFSDTAFRFYADGVNNATGTQIAGKPSNIAPGAQALSLLAVETNTDTGACDARFAGTTQTVQMAFECANPTTCQTNNGVVITDNTLLAPTAISDNPQGSVSAFTNVDLSFDATTATASWHINYADAGQIALHASLTIPASGNDPADTFSGSSNNFVVRPFGFDIDTGLQRADDWSDGSLDGTGPSGTDTSWAQNINGSVFTRAGNDFNVTLRPVVWSAGDDSDNDGVPDPSVNLTNNALTPNFGNEIATERVDILHARVLPVGAGTVNGSLTGGNNLNFSGLGGSLTRTLSWDEVGIIDLTASLDSGDYLSGGSTVTTTHEDFGRFYPDHFSLTTNPVTNRIALGGGGIFTYMDEDFQMSYTLSAENTTNGVTRNYTTASGFALLNTSTELNYAAVDTTLPIDLSGRLTTTNALINWVAGNLVLTDSASINRITSPDGPYSIMDVGVAPTDEDGVLLASYDLDVNADSTNDHALVSTTQIRFGRMALNNTFGSELVSLNMPMVAEYFNGSNFIVNSDDSLTPFSTAKLVLSSSVEGGQTDGDIQVRVGQVSTATINNNPILTGDAGLAFCPPGNPACTATSGNVGYIDVQIDLTVSPYLQFDWDADGNHDNDPTSRATFGIFNGNSKHIYFRQIY